MRAPPPVLDLYKVPPGIDRREPVVSTSVTGARHSALERLLAAYPNPGELRAEFDRRTRARGESRLPGTWFRIGQ